MIAAVVLAGAVAAAAGPPRFASKVESVSVDAFVTRNGQPVRGLTGADFLVKDDGVVQQVEVVDLGATRVGAVLAFDTSLSVAGAKLDALRGAAHAFVSGLHADDEAALVGFSHDVRLVAAPSTDRALFARALDHLSAIGSTALYDGLYAAIRLRLAEPRRVVVLFSDGADNVSWLTAGDLREPAADARVLIFAVVTTEPGDEIGGPAAGESGRRRILRRLVESTGGRVLKAASPADLAPQFQRILEELRTRYILSYVPASAPREGRHRLEVRVRRGGVKVRARSEYVVRRPGPGGHE